MGNGIFPSQVDLQADAVGKLGITLCMCDGGLLSAPYVCRVAQRSSAQRSGRVVPGDQLISIDGERESVCVSGVCDRDCTKCRVGNITRVRIVILRTGP